MILFVFVLGTVVSLVFGHVCTPRSKKGASIAQQPVTISNPSNSSCFPGMGSPFTMPETIPSSLAGWWCDYNTEYAFVGFGYDVTACQSLTTLKTDFSNIRNTFNGRYVRMYGACDQAGFYDNVVEAAWAARVGVQALIWFGFNGDDEWKTRRDTLFGVLHSNPKAKFVTRVVQFGSEPLYDNAINPKDLAAQVRAAKADLASLQIPVTVSDMAYGWQLRENDGAQDVMDAIDLVDAHMLPFFSPKATTARNSWPLVQSDINWFLQNSQNKKMYLTENGWPSQTYQGVESSSPSAVADIQNEHDYFTLLDEKCSYFKANGIGWFFHVYADYQDLGYGLYNPGGALKFPFAPRTSC